MAKSFLEECQAWLKHQLSDYWGVWGGKQPSLPSSSIKTLEFICTKSSLRAHSSATAVLLFSWRKRQKTQLVLFLQRQKSVPGGKSAGLASHMGGGNRTGLGREPKTRVRASLCQLRQATEPPRASLSSAWKCRWEKSSSSPPGSLC